MHNVEWFHVLCLRAAFIYLFVLLVIIVYLFDLFGHVTSQVIVQQCCLCGTVECKTNTEVQIIVMSLVVSYFSAGPAVVVVVTGLWSHTSAMHQELSHIGLFIWCIFPSHWKPLLCDINVIEQESLLCVLPAAWLSVGRQPSFSLSCRTMTLERLGEMNFCSVTLECAPCMKWKYIFSPLKLDYMQAHSSNSCSQTWPRLCWTLRPCSDCQLKSAFWPIDYIFRKSGRQKKSQEMLFFCKSDPKPHHAMGKGGWGVEMWFLSDSHDVSVRTLWPFKHFYFKVEVLSRINAQ